MLVRYSITLPQITMAGLRDCASRYCPVLRRIYIQNISDCKVSLDGPGLFNMMNHENVTKHTDSGYAMIDSKHVIRKE